MNNIYVDELPQDCLDCPCRDGESNKCNLIEFRPSIGYFDEKTLDFIYKPYYNKGEVLDCPLKKLTDRLAEERKKVVQEIRDKALLKQMNIDNDYDYEMGANDDWVIYMEDLTEILDQMKLPNKISKPFTIFILKKCMTLNKLKER